MKSTARLNGHPLHPMLIPYPFALLSSAAAYDVAASVRGRPDWAETGARLTTAGLASAMVAAMPGILDYFTAVPRRTSARRTATRHALLNLSALGCFAAASRLRNGGRALPRAGLSLELFGTGLLAAAGWLGGSLVYREHIGVHDEGAVVGVLSTERHSLHLGEGAIW